MMLRRGLFFVFVLLLVLPIAVGQGGLDGVDEIQEDVAKVQNIVGAVGEISEDEKYEFLKEGWTDWFSKNKVLGPVHRTMEKGSIGFLILFGKHYSLSLELLFSIGLWFATWLFLSGFLYFFKEGWQKTLGALALTIIMAQMQLFNLAATGLFKIMFYKQSFWWSLISLIVIGGGIFGYNRVGDMISKTLEAAREKAKAAKMELDVNRGKSRWEQMTEKADEIGGDGLTEQGR